MMQSWGEADEVWRNQAEAQTSEYATELDEYKQAHPRPQLGDWMKGFEG